MRVLLDTHAFLWWDLDDARLSKTAADTIRDGHNDVVISAGSIWEVAIKTRKGRLDLPDDLEAYVDDRMRRYHWTLLPIDARHAIRAASLPNIHDDPFDRVLIAQAQVEAIPLVTTDPAITRYDVLTIW